MRVGANLADRLTIDDFYLVGDGQCVGGQDASNYYFAAGGFASNTKNVRIGGANNMLIINDSLWLRNVSGGYVFSTGNTDRLSISVTGVLRHNAGSAVTAGSFYTSASVSLFTVANESLSGVTYFTLSESGTNDSTPFWISRNGSSHANPHLIEFWNFFNGDIRFGTNNTLRLTLGANPSFNSNSLRIVTAQTPASATAAGTQGQICWDANFVYVCVATNQWKRAALLTW